MSRLSYADVVATLALFIALGGPGYAAIELPRGSVRSAHIRDGTIRRADLAASARGHRAVVTAGGRLTGGDAVAAVRRGPGVYRVRFGTSVYRCAMSAAVAATSNSDGSDIASAGHLTVESRYPPSVVVARSYDSDGAPADEPFHLTVAC